MKTRHWAHGLLAATAAAALIGLGGCDDRSPAGYVERAKEHIQKRDLPAATVLLKAALQGGVDTAEVRFLLGSTLLASGDASSAAVELDKALQGGYSKDAVVPELVRALVLSGQGKRAVHEFDALTLKDPKAQATLRHQMAAAWAQLGDRARTEAALEAALQADPNFGPAIALKSRIVAGGGDVDRALGMLEAVLARDPGHAETWHLKGEMLFRGRNDVAGAEKAFRQALAVDPGYSGAWASLFRMPFARGDLQAASAVLAEMRRSMPEHPRTLLMEGQLALAKNDFKTARDRSLTLLKVGSGNTSVLMLAGMVEARAGSPTIALTRFGRVIHLEPENAMARREMARVHLRLGQAAKALAVVEPIAGEGSRDAEAVALAGLASAQLGKAGEAEARLATAASLEPDNARLGTMLASLRADRGDDSAWEELARLTKGADANNASMAQVAGHLRRGRLDEAQAAADAWAARMPGDALAHETRGRIQFLRRQLAPARASFEKALAIDPAMLAATLGLAAVDVAERKPERARERVLEATRSQPDNDQARLALARLLEQSGETPEQVRAAYRDAIDAAPQQAAPRLGLIEFLIGKKRYGEAQEVAQAATAAIPDDLNLLDALGRAQALQGDAQQALSTFRKVANIDPNRPVAHMRLATLMRAQGNRSAALGHLRRAGEADPDYAEARVALAAMLTAEGRTNEALAMARELQRRASRSPGGFLLEAEVHGHAKNPRAALAALRAGTVQQPDSALLHLVLFRALSASGDHGQALAVAEDWNRRHPADAAMSAAVGDAAMARGDHALAERHYRASLDKVPDQLTALNNLAWIVASSGRPGALPLAQRAVELSPNRPDVLDTLALAQAAERDFAGALKTQRKAVELAPGDPLLRLGLARIAIQAGDVALARTELERLSRLGSRFKEQAEAQRLLKGLPPA
ncbi:MAG: XrtA/PEP-CTERM system TPR-repeat protein PrsT [Pseudomonadota bacterium]